MSYLITILGLTFLIVGADLLIRACLCMSNRLGLSSAFSGASLLALGTSLPELLISITSLTKGADELAFGNIIGSNIFNTLLIGGVVFLFGFKKRSSFFYKFLFLLLSCFLFIIFFFNGVLGFLESFLLLAVLSFFIYFMVKQGKEDEKEEGGFSFHPLVSLVIFFLASFFLFIGSEMTVKGTQELGKLFAWPERVSGAIILAIGTGLPELIASLVALFKNKSLMAVGNIFGSNIFNLCLILSLSSFVTNRSVVVKTSGLDHDFLWLSLSTLFFFFFVLIISKFTTKKALGKTLGFVLLAFYAYYVMTLF